MTVQQIAQVVHEANKAFCEATGDFSQKSWNDAPQWQRDSILSVIPKLQAGTITAEQTHELWMADKLAAGWVYGLVKNPDAVPPTHHCLVPYSALPLEQQLKDHLVNAIVKVLTS